ncbi:MAG: type II toxin-antitoxin system HicB family antitoxin [Acidobacteriota bacterium]
MLKYQALFEPAEEGGFVVTFPDVEPAITQGDTEEEATLMAADVLTLAIEHYIDKGLPLPKAKTHRGPHYRWIRLPAIASAKAELHNAFLESGSPQS